MSEPSGQPLDHPPDTAPGPEARYEAREALALAFMAGLQRLPPRQRAVLVLRDVLDYPAAQAADMLETSEVSTNSALQRARATLGAQFPAASRDRVPAPRSPRERELVSRFVHAFEAADVGKLVDLLTNDAWLTMLPNRWIRGSRRDRPVLREPDLVGVQPARLVPTRANNQPAFGYYLRDPQASVARAHGLVVLTLAGDKICAITRFGDNSLFPHFGLPRSLPD